MVSPVPLGHACSRCCSSSNKKAHGARYDATRRELSAFAPCCVGLRCTTVSLHDGFTTRIAASAQNQGSATSAPFWPLCLVTGARRAMARSVSANLVKVDYFDVVGSR